MLSKEEFIAEASKTHVLLELDFPRKTELPKDQQEANEAASEEYKINVFPTIVLTDAEGKEYARGRSRNFTDIATSLKWLKAKVDEKDML